MESTPSNAWRRFDFSRQAVVLATSALKDYLRIGSLPGSKAEKAAARSACQKNRSVCDGQGFDPCLSCGNHACKGALMLAGHRHNSVLGSPALFPNLTRRAFCVHPDLFFDRWTMLPPCPPCFLNLARWCKKCPRTYFLIFGSERCLVALPYYLENKALILFLKI